MIDHKTNSYSVLPDEMEGNRIDFVFHHPDLNDIREFRRQNPKVLKALISSPEYGLSLSGLSEGETGFLNVQHLNFNGEVSFEPQTFIYGGEKSDLLKSGDILIARTGATLGKAAFITREFEGFAFGSFCLRFTPLSTDIIRPDFLALFLNCYWGQKQIFMLKTGAGQHNINAEQIKDIHIPDLSVSRQKEIVRAAKSIEAEARQLQIAVAKVRQAAADILPVEMDLPLATDEINYFFRSGEEKKSITFPIDAADVSDRLHYLFFHPRYRVLEELRDKFTCTALQNTVVVPIRRGEQPEYEEGGTIRVLKTINLKNGWIDYDGALRVSQELFDSKPTAQIQKGDILVASTGYGSMGKVDVYDNDEAAIVDGHVSILRPSASYNSHFLAYYLRSYLGQLQIEKWFSGSSGQIEIQPSDLHNIIVPTPDESGIPLYEQERIAGLITGHLNQARTLEAQAADKWKEARETFERMLLEGINGKNVNSDYTGAKASEEFTMLKERLESFNQLQDNWDEDGAQRPNDLAISRARLALVYLEELQLEPFTILPSVDNGVGMAFELENRYAEIEFSNNGDMGALLDESVPCAWCINNEGEIMAALERIKRFIYGL